jgi:solute:Na+ symporter, SSS family
METIDYIVLAVYFAGMAGIGFWLMRKQKGQEDFFMGGRRFGKLFQTFAAFGAGTGPADPVNTARGTIASGISGMWGVMYWLFVTPIYWISSVWYRRMRCLTLGDWFVERYESKRLGVAYALFGCFYYMLYGAMFFTAIGKVAGPLMGDALFGVPLQYSLLPIIATIIVVYGLLGGIAAAYWTDLIQGICIILLSVLLIPFGLNAVVDRFGTTGDSWTDGFRIMHEQLPEQFFTLVGSSSSSEFPLYAIVIIVLINIIGIVLTPHFIVTGGGSAKSEWDARIGLVTGNFIKRFCTVGWVITALIVLTLYSNDTNLVGDYDKAWGVATEKLLGPIGIGLVGLMVACLLAALMSSVDCYMLVCSALVVRNVYVPFVNPDAGEKECLRFARIIGVIVVAGSVLMSWTIWDLFSNLQLTWIFPVLFAAIFWLGMYWRRATAKAAWITFAFSLLFFFVIPILLPIVNSGIKSDPTWTRASYFLETTSEQTASPSDVRVRNAEIQQWEQKHLKVIGGTDANGKKVNGESHAELRQAKIESLGNKSTPLVVGQEFNATKKSGGTALFWTGKVKPDSSLEQADLEKEIKAWQKKNEPDDDYLDGLKGALATLLLENRNLKKEVEVPGVTGKMPDGRTVVAKQYRQDVPLVANGRFRLDMVIYDKFGVELATKNKAAIKTLDLPFAIIAPFLVMVVASLLTKPNSKEALDRLYVKMKTPVDPDPEKDKAELEKSYAEPSRFDHKKLFPGTNLEIQRPTKLDFLGFLICVAICFTIIGLVLFVAQIGA